jgi:hypothetical protein
MRNPASRRGFVHDGRSGFAATAVAIAHKEIRPGIGFIANIM